MNQMIDLIIKNGYIVTPYSTYKADIAISGGKIEGVGSAALFGKAKREIEAGGKYILPGLIDVHNHFEAPFMGCMGALDFYKGSVAGAFGGVTTILDFTNTKPGDSVLQKVKERQEEMSKSAVDFGVHAKFVEATQPVLNEIRDIVEYGCPSFKLFMTYKKEGIMISDEGLLQVFEESGKWGALPGVHAESNAIAETNIEKFIALGTLDWEYFEKAKPSLCELEAVERAINLAKYAGSALYIFHLSSEAGLNSVKRAQSSGQKVYAETCPHYLKLTKEKYKGRNGYLYIMSPPLKEQKDIDALWEGISNSYISVIGSDNCAYSIAEKEMFLSRDENGEVIPDFTKVVNGVTGIEERILLLQEEGVNKGRISLNKLCEISSFNPARIFGMYPQKGVIQKGSDADLVIIDPEMTREISHNTLHYGMDYSIYEGTKVKGWPVMTIAKGVAIVEDGEFTGKRGAGDFLKRKPFNTDTLL